MDMKELWDKPQKRVWLAIVGSSTLILAAAYAMAQQTTRQAADDLPLATAQTIKHELDDKAAPTDVVPNVKTDLNSDSTVFAIVTDNSQHILASSARLDGKTPLPPIGVFQFTAAHGNDHFTWQPATNVRLATQVLSYGTSSNGGFIITGQSLKQAEKRIDTYTVLAAAAWIAIVGWGFLILMAPSPKKKK